MTMPEKIWIDETSEDCDGFIMGRYDRKYGNVDQCYIRKDLADELAGALDDARATILELINMRGSEAEGSDADWVGEYDAALARYNAATEGSDRA